MAIAVLLSHSREALKVILKITFLVGRTAKGIPGNSPCVKGEVVSDKNIFKFLKSG